MEFAFSYVYFWYLYKSWCGDSSRYGQDYCETAQKWCERFPKPDDPNPDEDDDNEGFFRCTRQCLQDCDGENSCGKDKEDLDGFWDAQHFGCHVKCYIECGAWGIGCWEPTGP